MPELRQPANDFERWIAGSRVPPAQRTPDELCDGIAAAIRCRDLLAVEGLMIALAFAGPRKAQAIHDMIKAVAAGDTDLAVLLAVLGG